MGSPDTSAFWACFDQAECGSAPDWLSFVTACAAEHPSGHASLLAYSRRIECEQCPSCEGWTGSYGCE